MLMNRDQAQDWGKIGVEFLSNCWSWGMKNFLATPLLALVPVQVGLAVRGSLICFSINLICRATIIMSIDHHRNIFL